MKRHFTHHYLLNPVHRITVALVGAGGTGSQVLHELARIDHALYKLGHPGLFVTVYDDDIVTEANIGRQLFSPSDIGLNKAMVLVDRVNSFFGLDWLCKSSKFPVVSQDDCHNITMTCVDNVASRLTIGSYLRQTNNKALDGHHPLYWIDFGNQADRGQVVIGTAEPIRQPESKTAEGVPSLPCVDEMFDLSKIDEKESGPSCSLAEALRKQDLFINSMLSQVGCNLLWKLITEGGLDCRGAFVNLKSMNVNPIRL